MVHWKLVIKFNFEAGDKWYEHEPESAFENEDYKILWDFSIQTDHVTEAWRPDLVVADKKERICKIIDFAVFAVFSSIVLLCVSSVIVLIITLIMNK